MKNAMKKLMSVLLVAVLLISAVPFAASAASQVTVCVKVDGVEKGTVTVDLNGGSATVGDIMKWKENVKALMSGNFCHSWKKGMGNAVGGSDLVVNAGETVYLAFYTDLNDCPKCNTAADKDEDQTPTETPSEPVATEPAATEPTVKAVTFVVKVSKKGEANTGEVVYEGSKVPSNGVSCKVGDLLSYCWNSKWTGVYEFDHAWSKSKNATTYDKDSAIAAGDEVHIMLKPVSKKNDNGSNNSGSNNSGITNKDNTNQVWLHVYINGNAGTIAKSINLTNTYLMDDNSTNTTEIKNYLLTNYYQSSDSSKNVELDGLYLNKGTSGTFPQNYYTDGNKFSTLSDIDDMLDDGYVHISVMLKNVTAKTTTTTTADSSNPKTGDSIYTAMTVMGISAASLAAVMYVYTKKRQAI